MADSTSTNNLEDAIKKEFGEEATPEFCNLLKIAKLVLEHGYNNYIPKEKLLEFVEKIYDSGEQQRKIKQGKEHGRILIGTGDVSAIGAYLSLFGKRDGYLSK